MPVPNNLREERFTLAHSLRGYSSSWWRRHSQAHGSNEVAITLSYLGGPGSRKTFDWECGYAVASQTCATSSDKLPAATPIPVKFLHSHQTLSPVEDKVFKHTGLWETFHVQTDTGHGRNILQRTASFHLKLRNKWKTPNSAYGLKHSQLHAPARNKCFLMQTMEIWKLFIIQHQHSKS